MAPKHRVLIVDDQIGVADSLARLLKMMGQEVCVAYGGIEAIEVASKVHPDMILLDIGMPNLDGYDTCRQIRQQHWGKGILMAAVTGWGGASDVQRALEAGFDRHLAKPVDRSTLAKLLASVESPAPAH